MTEFPVGSTLFSFLFLVLLSLPQPAVPIGEQTSFFPSSYSVFPQSRDLPALPHRCARACFFLSVCLSVCSPLLPSVGGVEGTAAEDSMQHAHWEGGRCQPQSRHTQPDDSYQIVFFSHLSRP
jgi:hypothetical protein